jgi:F-type H+-transporting ATPase subunit epsilon
MADRFTLQLVTPTGVVFDGEAEQVTAVGPLGEFGILAEHINFITSLVPGLLEIRTAEGARTYVISGGFAEVKEGAVTLLANSAEEPSAVDVSKLDAEMAEAERRISEASFYSDEYESAEHDMLLALAHKQASELKSPAH